MTFPGLEITILTFPDIFSFSMITGTLQTQILIWLLVFHMLICARRIHSWPTSESSRLRNTENCRFSLGQSRKKICRCKTPVYPEGQKCLRIPSINTQTVGVTLSPLKSKHNLWLFENAETRRGCLSVENESSLQPVKETQLVIYELSLSLHRRPKHLKSTLAAISTRVE